MGSHGQKSVRCEAAGFLPVALPRVILSFMLTTFICFFSIPKPAHANPAIAVPGIIAACEAAGISVDTWALAMTAIITGTTGISLVGAAYDYQANIAIPRDQRHWKTPGWPDWDSLTPEEKQQSGCTSNYEYYLQWLEAYALVYGMYTPGNGNNDPDDPDGPKFSSDLVSQIGAISTGGIALASYRYPTDKGNYLFSPNGLGLLYQETLVVDGAPVNTQILDLKTPTDVWGVAYYGSFNLQNPWVRSPILSTNRTEYDKFNYHTIELTKNPSNQWVITQQPISGNDTSYIMQQDYYNNLVYNHSENFKYFSSVNVSQVNSSNIPLACINACYGGEYVFNTNDGQLTFKQNLAQGTLSHTQDIDYGQLPDTPIALQQAVPSIAMLNNYFENVDNSLTENNSTYIVAPDIDTINEPSYSDFVEVKDVSQVNPSPNPNPNPEVQDVNVVNVQMPTSYPSDTTEQINRFLRTPFEQVFPFCLVGDTRIFLLKLNDVAFPAQQGEGFTTQSLDDTFVLTIPLDKFGVPGMDSITIDASILEDLGGYTKIGFNALWVATLLQFAYRLFLRAGS